jgi:hypothetical protein
LFTQAEYEGQEVGKKQICFLSIVPVLKKSVEYFPTSAALNAGEKRVWITRVTARTTLPVDEAP